mgnify:CR=1 FL=1
MTKATKRAKAAGKGQWDPTNPWPVFTEIHYEGGMKPDILAGVGPDGQTLLLRQPNDYEHSVGAAQWNKYRAKDVAELVFPPPKPPPAAGIGLFSSTAPWPEASMIVLEDGRMLTLIETDLETQVLTISHGDPTVGRRETISFEDWNAEWAGQVDEVRFPDGAAPEPGEAPADVKDKGRSVQDPPKGHAPSLQPGRPPKADLVLVPIDRIDATHNVRTDMGEAQLLLLEESIRDIGQLQPVVVRKVGKGFELVAGHRRLEAARRAGEELIEARVYAQVDDQWTAKARLAENIQRMDLNHMELAAVLGEAVDSGCTVAETAQQSHLSDDSVRRHLALRRLCPPVAELVAKGRLPVHQAELIARVGDVARQIDLAEHCLALGWDSKRGKWSDKPNWQHKDGDPTDYIMPMEELRKNVSSALCGLAACGWLKVEEQAAKHAGSGNPADLDLETPISEAGGIAGQRPCAGCPDNTCTYADQPTLFAGVHPQGSDKRGYCSNRACFEAKEKVWGKVTDRRRQQKEKAQRQAITQAQDAGLDVCEGCARVAADGEHFKSCRESCGQKLCEKCTEKAKKRASAGGGGRREPERPFPQEPAEHLAVAIAGYAKGVLTAITAWAAEQDKADLPDDQYLGALADLLALQVALGRLDKWARNTIRLVLDLDTKPFVSMAQMGELMADGGCDERHGLLEAFARMQFGGRPGYQAYYHEVTDVPIPDGDMEFLGLVETFCQARRISIPDRPTERSIATAGLRQQILAADQGALPGVLAKVAVEDQDVLAAILAEGEAGTLKPKLAKWRAKMIAGSRPPAGGP